MRNAPVKTEHPSLVQERLPHPDESRAIQLGLPLDEYIDQVAQDLHQRVEHQRWLAQQVIAGDGRPRPRGACCQWVECPRLERLRAALGETAEVLEQTRTSFKSKRLEVMRKKLTDLLAGG